CIVTPALATATHLSLPLTYFDLIWLRFHPVERIFFYSLPLPNSDPCFFFDKVAPKLKTSLSRTLQHFLPLAGNVIWPSDSPKPFIQFNPGDGVSLVLAQCHDDSDFDHFLDYSPREATQSRTLVPILDSSDSLASVISLQITLFPKKGFCIGITSHHAVLDGKSSTMFIKAWAYACKSGEEESPPSLVPELEPLFDRELIKDPMDLESVFINNWTQMDPSGTSNGRSLKIISRPMEEHLVRATFELTREDLEKIKKRVLSMWELVEEEAEPNLASSKPTTLSTFVTTIAYVSVCISKAIHGAQNIEKFALGFNVDCRARPAKVEITSVDRGLNIGLADSKDGKGGVEVGLVLDKQVMDLFHVYFHADSGTYINPGDSPI
ncbi:Malonyl-CoA:anthocyanidin 5-O-glucoside-6''-O-malonyltransferase, partial [Mucuna pruriens]